jgi:hypothetical protein
MRRFSGPVGVVMLLLVATTGEAEARQAGQPCQIAAPPALDPAAVSLDLGCPTSQPFTTAASEQPFEHGSMLWLQEWGIVNVLREDGGYDGYDDQYSPDKPESGGLTPPSPELQEPRQGFGLIWRKLGGPDAPIGWATAGETSYVATVQYFERGAMIQRGDGDTLAFAIYNHTRGQWAPASPTAGFVGAPFSAVMSPSGSGR